jgi:uncharacterized protein (TIGR04255 family)
MGSADELAYVQEDGVSGHPSYPNPQLVEALCEFHLRFPANDPWKPSKPGAFFKAVQDSYPEIEPVTQQGVQLVIGPDNVPQQQLLPPRITFRLKHAEQPLLLQLSEQIFTINALRPYPGWAYVKAELGKVWPLVLEILKPDVVARIGMRYINRIIRRSAGEEPGFWLRACDFIPQALLKSGPGFQLRLQTRVNANGRVVLTIAHDDSDKKEMHGAMIFDIDRIIEGQASPIWNEIDVAVETLHEEIWQIFEVAKGPNLDALLRRQAQ